MFAVYEPKYLYVSWTALLLIKNAILYYSIRRFQKFIASIKFSMENHKLVRLHFLNIFTYTVLYALSATFYIITDDLRDERPNSTTLYRMSLLFAIFIGLSGVFQVWNVLFIFYVLLRQTRTTKMDSPVDTILQKEVPTIVFV